MKKIACGILILMLSIILVACGSNKDMQVKSSAVIDAAPYHTYIFHDDEYNKDYIIVTYYSQSIAITPRLTN